LKRAFFRIDFILDSQITFTRSHKRKNTFQDIKLNKETGTVNFIQKRVIFSSIKVTKKYKTKNNRKQKFIYNIKKLKTAPKTKKFFEKTIQLVSSSKKITLPISDTIKITEDKF